MIKILNMIILEKIEEKMNSLKNWKMILLYIKHNSKIKIYRPELEN